MPVRHDLARPPLALSTLRRITLACAAARVGRIASPSTDSEETRGSDTAVAVITTPSGSRIELTARVLVEGDPRLAAEEDRRARHARRTAKVDAKAKAIDDLRALDTSDPEVAHRSADAILLDLIKDPNLIAEYNRIPRWYS